MSDKHIVFTRRNPDVVLIEELSLKFTDKMLFLEVLNYLNKRNVEIYGDDSSLYFLESIKKDFNSEQDRRRKAATSQQQT